MGRYEAVTQQCLSNGSSSIAHPPGSCSFGAPDQSGALASVIGTKPPGAMLTPPDRQLCAAFPKRLDRWSAHFPVGVTRLAVGALKQTVTVRSPMDGVATDRGERVRWRSPAILARGTDIASGHNGITICLKAV